jgi:hypothetical protein
MHQLRLRWRRLAAITTGFLLATVGIPASVATAEQSNCGTKSNYFAGFYYSPSNHPGYNNMNGASSFITVQRASVCDFKNGSPATGLGNFTAEWSMLASNADLSNQAYGQSGYIRWYGSSNVDFSEYNNDNGIFMTKYLGTALANGDQRAYRTRYNSACRCLVLSVNGSTIDTSTFDPYSYFATPFSPEFSAETAYTASDIPGTTSTHAKFSGMGYQDASTGNLYSIPCILSGTPSSWGSPRYHYAANSCTAFDTYTDPLS